MTPRSSSALRKPAKTATKKTSAKTPAKSVTRSSAKFKTGKLPEWNLADLIPASMRRKSPATSPEWIRIALRLRPITRENWPNMWRKRTAAAGSLSSPALRGDRRSGRTARLLCGAGACRRQRRSRDHQILWRCVGAADRGFGAFAVFRARTQPGRRCRDRARDADAGARPLPALDRRSAQGKTVSARRPRRAVVS